GGVERQCRVLWDVRDSGSAQRPHGHLVEFDDLDGGGVPTRPDAHRTGSELQPLTEMAHAGQPGRGLARARFADETEDLSAGEREVDAVEDLIAGIRLDPQVGDAQDDLLVRFVRRVVANRFRLRAHHASTEVDAVARAKESASRLVPMVSSAIAMTGSSTPQGWMDRAMRFSLIISPQSAAGGCRP